MKPIIVMFPPVNHEGRRRVDDPRGIGYTRWLPSPPWKANGITLEERIEQMQQEREEAFKLHMPYHNPSLCSTTADEALVERDDALDDVRKLKRELQDIKTGVKDEIHSLRADLNLISTERDVMRETLAAVHSASGTLAERLDDEASYGEFYDMFKWLWACSGPDLDRATVESQDSIKKNRLIEGLVKAVIEAQSVKADLCRERQICGELRQEAASLKAKLEGLKKSESDAQAQLVVKIEALRAAEVSCQQTKEGLESAERRGVWLTGQVREMQSLVNEKDALVQKLQREVSTAGEDARDLEERDTEGMHARG
ncbi:hypothetical protein FOL47_010016 [Perkinsus chesapeaki]|uniref:Uncharacterized protein n=1 Tax=Perkinsus chesapeaki TaxID=330153 RepID=A0A7J6MRA2_PERCH|nr:hypothetical protein FOL47_010016 [Perkinsus chesapeaki]